MVPRTTVGEHAIVKINILRGGLQSGQEVVFRRVLNSDARCPEKLHNALKEILEWGMKILIPFPKPSQGIERCQRWIYTRSRENFTVDKITRSSNPAPFRFLCLSLAGIQISMTPLDSWTSLFRTHWPFEAKPMLTWRDQVIIIIIEIRNKLTNQRWAPSVN